MTHSTFPFRAILFDFDGVVADTMPGNMRAWAAAFRQFGVEIDPRDYFAMEGSGAAQIAQALCERYGLDTTHASEIALRKDDHLVRNSPLLVYPGIPELLDRLIACGVPRAVVTGARKARILRTVPAELMARFDQIVTSDDVVHPKPDPEPYRKGAELLGVPPESALVVENAPFGIHAAKMAGCTCAAIQTTLGSEFLTEADQVFASHAAFYDWLNPQFPLPY